MAPFQTRPLQLKMDELPGSVHRAPVPTMTRARIRHLDGCWITPGLIDCHTHIAFAGNRAHEWEMRRNGASYEEIALAGGGIASTVACTRKASEDALIRIDRAAHPVDGIARCHDP